MKRNGFTLIEIVISISLIALAFYTLMSFLSNTAFKNVASQQVLTGSFLAEQAMEEFTMEDKDWSTDYVTQETVSFGGDFSNYTYRVDVEYVDLDNLAGKAVAPPTDYKRIEVLVSNEAMNIPVKLTTLKVRYGQ